MERRISLDNQYIAKPMKDQTLIERIRELERFVDKICKMEIEILNLKDFVGIESKND